MNIKQLEHLLTLSKKHTFTKAAQELYITQQGLSHSLCSLEEELQVSLFERSKDGVRLTEAGKLIYPRVKTFNFIS